MDMLGGPIGNDATTTLPMHLHIPGGSSSESEEFLMYTYKVKRCSKTRSHDWTECPYAHRGEKARRRDPRKFPYDGVVCSEFRYAGECRRGQNCEFAHGVFEFWLHPSRYRTRVCEAGLLCPRRICFFAHSLEQLRPEVVRGCLRCHSSAAAAARKVNARLGCAPSSSPMLPSFKDVSMEEEEEVGVEEDHQFDGPDIGWIVDLVK